MNLDVFRAARRGLQRAGRRRAAFDALVGGISAGGFLVEVDRDGRIVRWSEGAEVAFGRPRREALGKPLGSVCRELEAVRLASGTREESPARPVVHHGDGGPVAAGVVVAPIRRHGSALGAWIIGRTLGPGRPDPARDPVTGLRSAAAFTADLARAIDGGAAPCVLLIDVDGIDAVNQTAGHQAGEELLRVLARRLRAALAPGEVAARFVRRLAVLAPDAGADEAEALARTLGDALGGTVDTRRGMTPVAVRIGVSRAVPGEDATTVIRHADLALVAAQESGSGCEVYDQAVHRAVEARREQEIDLRSAVSRGEFVVHYQPVVDLRDNGLVGAEALIRWRRPNGDLVMPGDFISVAETSGAIVGIGLWVLEEACGQVRRWNERYRLRDPLEIAVNLSVRQLSSRALTGDIAAVLAGVGIHPDRVTLEVTESSLMDDPDRMIGRLDELREMGVTLSMDDFGTGYSSLSYLRQLPIDVVKIDRSFVGGVARSDEEWALAVAIVKLATSLGKRTLAEGVETPAQLAHLRALRCDLAQGFLFSRPLPAEEFEKLLQGGGRRPLGVSAR